MPVHLYGQGSDMESIMHLAEKYKIYVIEDNTQALGAETIFEDRTTKKTRTIGCNSRLDTIHAAVLNVKLNYLDTYIAARRKAVDYYYQNLKELALW